MISSHFKSLKIRAEELLKQRNKLASEGDEHEIEELIRNLISYQSDLELQNRTLQSAYIELEELSTKYEKLYNSAPIGYFLLDHNGLIINTNDAGAELLGVRKSTLMNKSFSKYIAPEFQYDFTQFRLSAQHQVVLPTCEVKILKRNNPIAFVRLEGRVIINPKTDQIEIFISAIDYTLQKQQENSSQDNHSTGSVSQMNSIIISGINQPLAVIANYIHGCIHRIKSGNYQPEVLLQALEQAAQQLHRTAEIILRMKNFGCKEIFKYDKHDLDALITETLDLIKGETDGFPVTIQYRPASGLPKIYLDRIYIQQVILNLGRNAIEAMRDADIKDAKLIIEVNRPDIKLIEVSVLDNGPGVSIKTVHKLFNPHFTTKSYGIGLGLVVSRSIIESHGGKLSVESNATCGACFKFTLPISEK